MELRPPVGAGFPGGTLARSAIARYLRLARSAIALYLGLGRSAVALYYWLSAAHGLVVGGPSSRCWAGDARREE